MAMVNDRILLPYKQTTIALSPRDCAYAALCIEKAFEKRLGKPLSDAHKQFLLRALTARVTSGSLVGFPLIVDSFAEWFLQIAKAFGHIFTRSNKPTQINISIFRSGKWVDKPKVSGFVEQYLKAFACDDYPKHLATRNNLLETRKFLNSPPITVVRCDHELIVWIENNKAAITNGNAITAVMNNMQQSIDQQGTSIKALETKSNAHSAAIMTLSRILEAVTGYQVIRILIMTTLS